MANSNFAAPRRMREAWLWVGAGVIALALLLVFGILSLIAARGLWVKYCDRKPYAHAPFPYPALHEQR